MKKALNVIANILIVLVLVFACTLTFIVISSTKSEVGIPNIGGKAIFNVETDSMDKETGFPAGAMIVVDLVDKEEAKQLKVGDVITFRATEGSQVYLDTHRIIEVLNQDGAIYYRTQGDNTVTFDEIPAYSDNVIGVWTGLSVNKLGSALSFLQQPTGFLICIVIPMAIFFFFELYKFIAALMEKKKQKAVAAVADAEDEIKQKAIAEYLAQQEAEKAKQAQTPAEPVAPEVHHEPTVTADEQKPE